MAFTVQQIAEALGATAFGATEFEVDAVAEPADAGPRDLALAMKPDYAEQIAQGGARVAMLWPGADWAAFGLEAAIIAPAVSSPCSTSLGGKSGGSFTSTFLGGFGPVGLGGLRGGLATTHRGFHLVSIGLEPDGTLPFDRDQFFVGQRVPPGAFAAVGDVVGGDPEVLVHPVSLGLDRALGLSLQIDLGGDGRQAVVIDRHIEVFGEIAHEPRHVVFEILVAADPGVGLGAPECIPAELAANCQP